MKNNIKKYRIIGDQHGRTNWHQLVEPFDEETMYIFMGDFTDPYYGWEKVTYEQMIEEINKAFTFKREHPDNVIILASNHDLQYIIKKGETNRYEYNINRREELFKIFKENEGLLDGVAYSIDDKYLVTHAGVTFDWYTIYCSFDENTVGKEPLEDIALQVNNMWELNPEAFTFEKNAFKFSDYCGTSPSHSPVWVRPETLWEHNLLGFESGRIQIIGHTPFKWELSDDWKETYNRIGVFGTKKKPITEEEIERGYFITDGEGNTCSLVANDYEHVDIIFTDCLRRETACVDIDAETLEWKKFSVGEDVMKIEDIL